MLAFLSLLPSRDWFYAALIIGLVAWGAKERHDLLAEGARHESQAVAAATLKAQQTRAAELMVLAKQDAQNLIDVRTDYETRLTASAKLTASLSARLRDYLNASRSSAAVPGDPATSAGPDGPAGESDGVAGALQGVIDAAGQDADKVIALQQYVLKECH